MRFLNVYEASREYGGPEEGGWYYDAGVPVLSVPVMLTDAGVPAHVYDAWQELRGLFPRTGKRSSVLGGEDWDVKLERHPAQEFPTETPHYE